MTDRGRVVGPLTGVLVVLVASVAFAGAATPVAGQSGGVALACADGSGGGPVAETDTGLEVADNASRAASQPSFPTNDTVALDGVAFSAAGEASLRLEDASPSTVCAADVSAGTASVTVAPDNATTVVVGGQPSRFAFTGPSLAGDGTADLAYQSDAPVTVRFEFDTPPSAGLEFVDSDLDTVATTRPETPEQAVILPAGEYALDVQTLGGDTGGSVSQESGSGGEAAGEGGSSGDSGGGDSGGDVSIEEGENLAGGGGGDETTETPHGEAIRAPGGGSGAGGLVTPGSTPTPSNVGEGGVARFGGAGGGGGGAPLLALLGLLVVVLVGVALFVRRR